MGNITSYFSSSLPREEPPESLQRLSEEQVKELGSLLPETCACAFPVSADEDPQQRQQLYSYHKLRAVWNLDKMGWPTAIVQPRTAEQIASLLKFANKHDIPVCVRSFGAHSGLALVDNCLAIDMSNFRQVVVDPEAKTVSVGGGCIIRDVDDACQPDNLALVMGQVNHTGVAGMALNATSGIGYLTRTRGLCVQHLQSVDLVLANGDILTDLSKDSSNKDHAELFWGVCGAGSNFGIATKMVFRLSKVPSTVLSGDIVKFPIGEGPPIWNTGKTRLEILMNHIRYFQGDENKGRAPDEVSALIILAGQGPVVARAVYIPMEKDVDNEDVLAKAKEGLAPLQNFGTSFINNVKERNYFSGLQKMATIPPSYYYQKAATVGILPEVAWGKICDLIKTAPPKCDIIIQPMMCSTLHGLTGGEFPTAPTFSVMQYWIMFLAEFPKGKSDPEHRDKCIAWVRDVYNVAEPYIVPAKPSSSDVPNASMNYCNECYGDTTIGNEDRLVKIKETYDPKNFFRYNRNIVPTTAKK